ncbi:MAG TPA: hypothetical protein V6D25_13045 [Leptolyngbyaceae cyanobacterium]
MIGVCANIGQIFYRYFFTFADAIAFSRRKVKALLTKCNGLQLMS